MGSKPNDILELNLEVALTQSEATIPAAFNKATPRRSVKDLKKFFSEPSNFVKTPVKSAAVVMGEKSVRALVKEIESDEQRQQPSQHTELLTEHAEQASECKADLLEPNHNTKSYKEKFDQHYDRLLEAVKNSHWVEFISISASMRDVVIASIRADKKETSIEQDNMNDRFEEFLGSKAMPDLGPKQVHAIVAMTAYMAEFSSLPRLRNKFCDAAKMDLDKDSNGVALNSHHIFDSLVQVSSKLCPDFIAKMSERLDSSLVLEASGFDKVSRYALLQRIKPNSLCRLKPAKHGDLLTLFKTLSKPQYGLLYNSKQRKLKKLINNYLRFSHTQQPHYRQRQMLLDTLSKFTTDNDRSIPGSAAIKERVEKYYLQLDQYELLRRDQFTIRVSTPLAADVNTPSVNAQGDLYNNSWLGFSSNGDELASVPAKIITQLRALLSQLKNNDNSGQYKQKYQQLINRLEVLFGSDIHQLHRAVNTKPVLGGSLATIFSLPIGALAHSKESVDQLITESSAILDAMAALKLGQYGDKIAKFHSDLSTIKKDINSIGFFADTAILKYNSQTTDLSSAQKRSFTKEHDYRALPHEISMLSDLVTKMGINSDQECNNLNTVYGLLEEMLNKGPYAVVAEGDNKKTSSFDLKLNSLMQGFKVTTDLLLQKVNSSDSRLYTKNKKLTVQQINTLVGLMNHKVQAFRAEVNLAGYHDALYKQQCKDKGVDCIVQAPVKPAESVVSHGVDKTAAQELNQSKQAAVVPPTEGHNKQHKRNDYPKSTKTQSTQQVKSARNKKILAAGLTTAAVALLGGGSAAHYLPHIVGIIKHVSPIVGASAAACSGAVGFFAQRARAAAKSHRAAVEPSLQEPFLPQ